MVASGYEPSNRIETIIIKHVLVTGAGGYVGIPLCRELVGRGYRVTALDRYFFGTDKLGDLSTHPNITVVLQDIRLLKPNLLEGYDGVIDLAGLSNDLTAEIDPELTREINFEGGAALAKTAKAAGVRRYVYSSSASVYGQGLKTSLIESDKCRPQTLYAQSKLYVEKRLKELEGNGFEPVIFRNATVFGLAPRMRFDLAVNIMTFRAWKDRVIYVMGGGQQWRPFVHVDDVVDILIRGLEAESKIVAGEIFNVGDESMNHQIQQLAEFVLDVIPNVTVHNIPDDPDKRTYNLAFGKIKQTLNFAAKKTVHQGIVEIKEALDRGLVTGDDPTCYTLQWYKSLIEWQKRIDGLTLDGKLL
jgi:nucleoside-diphosphate-sugar epimerase